MVDATMAATTIATKGASRQGSNFQWAFMMIALFLVGTMVLQIQQIPFETAGDALSQSKFAFLHPNQQESPVALPYEQRVSSPVINDDSPPYHVVFSTSCSAQQHWESMVFFYHAMRVGQRGTVTRIASGCSEEESQSLKTFHERYIQPMSPNFFVHFTPDYSRLRLSGGKDAYKYMNKPYGLRHWMEHALGMRTNQTNSAAVEDGIVFLMDPDMILLRPIVHDFSDVNNHLWVENEPLTKVVRHGFPIAQQDGYLNNEWMKLNFSYIVNRPEGAFVSRPALEDGPRLWNTGPPYLATVKDMYQIAVTWTEYAPRVLDVYPKLFAEMYGFIIATVQLKLPHTLLKSIVVSTTTAANREGWPLVDAIPDDQICDPSTTANMPIGLHYCKRYILERNFFSKYRLRKNIMDCDKPLLQPPPTDMVVRKIDWGIWPPRADLSDRNTYNEERSKIRSKPKREAFMLCNLVRSINEALRYHKELACDGNANWNEVYNLYDDPARH